jgi:peptide deformylase
MPVRRILQLGDPLLRAASARVLIAAEAEPVFADLRDTLHEFQRAHGFGRGISAVQIGEPKRLIYIELGGRAYRLRNPEFEFQSEEEFQLWDDCFSFPGLLVRLARAQRVRMRYEEEDGRARVLEAEGAFSELLQHEIDHLDGVLAIDRALDRNSLCTREEWQRTYARAQGSGS